MARGTRSAGQYSQIPFIVCCRLCDNLEMPLSNLPKVEDLYESISDSVAQGQCCRESFLVFGITVSVHALAHAHTHTHTLHAHFLRRTCTDRHLAMFAHFCYGCSRTAVVYLRYLHVRAGILGPFVSCYMPEEEGKHSSQLKNKPWLAT